MATRGTSIVTKSNSGNGHVVPTEPKKLKLPVNDDVLKRVYGLTLKCRLREERQGKDVAHSEAALAGAVVELTADDSVLATARGALTETLNGVPIIPIEDSGSSQLVIAAGVALAAKIRKKEDVVVAFTDMATLSFGGSHEALTFAAAHKLALVVFVRCGQDSSKNGTVLRRADALGIPGILVDANDAVAIYRVGKEAIHQARVGRGASLIECCPSEMDPVEHMERYLKKQRLWSGEWKKEIAGQKL